MLQGDAMNNTASVLEMTAPADTVRTQVEATVQSASNTHALRMLSWHCSKVIALANVQGPSKEIIPNPVMVGEEHVNVAVGATTKMASSAHVMGPSTWHTPVRVRLAACCTWHPSVIWMVAKMTMALGATVTDAHCTTDVTTTATCTWTAGAGWQMISATTMVPPDTWQPEIRMRGASGKDRAQVSVTMTTAVDSTWQGERMTTVGAEKVHVPAITNTPVPEMLHVSGIVRTDPDAHVTVA